MKGLNKILFFLLLSFSKAPLRVLYVFSDIIFVLLYYVSGYRKKVVMKNLKNSFPNKTKQELKSIQKAFYKNFSDYIVETLKSFTISDTELKIRVQHLNQHLFSEAKAEGKNVIMLAGHIFNWEWINALATVLPQSKCFPIYRKIQNSSWEEKIKSMRSRFGNTPIEAHQVVRHMVKTPNDGDAAYMFIADQSPYVLDIHYGLNFLNQKTPAFIGYDRLSTKMDLVFIFCEMKKVKRGHYQVTYQRIYPDNDYFEQYEVVKKFHRLLENTIRKAPSNWLWSHRRWKYQDAVKNMEEPPIS
ncbi:lysophospholipid acyltransferase family protein [Riemerella columbipharyngis]|uniref:KDO2-lipid IV(A) lauroyltransferase n=1 Tax=Riemerella columbipharyngis TaxID=1071918 RepID=A0A1G6YQ29_9FLAO|nr:lysophospholipid acyltransferase family protein [Riemerella columbipharyngis]SDD92421.1 KDO2-lipid IV(A) lauroyltransferase [Riemerella columbipharyngis]